jgi:hypothetical protein
MKPALRANQRAGKSVPDVASRLERETQADGHNPGDRVPKANALILLHEALGLTELTAGEVGDQAVKARMVEDILGLRTEIEFQGLGYLETFAETRD